MGGSGVKWTIKKQNKTAKFDSADLSLSQPGDDNADDQSDGHAEALDAERDAAQ